MRVAKRMCRLTRQGATVNSKRETRMCGGDENVFLFGAAGNDCRWDRVPGNNVTLRFDKADNTGPTRPSDAKNTRQDREKGVKNASISHFNAWTNNQSVPCPRAEKGRTAYFQDSSIFQSNIIHIFHHQRSNRGNMSSLPPGADHTGRRDARGILRAWHGESQEALALLSIQLPNTRSVHH